MRLSLPILLVLIPVTAVAQYRNSGYSELQDGEVVTSLKSHISYLSSPSMEGRKAGSEGEKETAIYLSSVLADYGLDVLSGKEGDVFGIKQETGDTLTSRNVVAYIQGYDQSLKNRYIVIGARMDNWGSSTTMVDGEPVGKTFYGANGNASGMAALLQLSRMLQTNKVLLRRSVLLVAFGASIPDGAGAWYFLNRSFADAANIDAMINLDMLGTGASGFYAYTASNADMDALVRAQQATLQPVQPRLVSLEPVKSDHRIFYASKIPSVFFTTGMYPEYNTPKDVESIIQYEDMERELEYIYNFSIALANGKKMEFSPAEQQNQKHSRKSDVVPYYECDQKPSFLGSTDPTLFLKKWVYTYLRYPPGAVAEGVQGRVLVDFIIDKKGKVTDVKVLKGVDERLDAEAVRAISCSPEWKPGRVRGEKVNSEMSLYVEFRLKKK